MDSCAGKLIRSNHRLMGTYVQLMPRMVQRRMEEMESKAAENAKAAAVAPLADVETVNVDASSAFQTAVNSPPAPSFPSSGTDVIPEVQSSVLKSAGPEVLTDPAATLLMPKTETVLNDASQTAGSGSPKPTSSSAPTET